jgi:hypothetical protein
VTKQFLDSKPNDANIQASFEIYAKIQNEIVSIFSTFDDIPKDGDPTDLVIHSTLQAFVQVLGTTKTQAEIQEIKQILANFANRNRPSEEAKPLK